jgi:hypothetical protein
MGFSHDLSESAVTCSCLLAATTIADLGSSWGPDWAAEPTFRPVVRDQASDDCHLNSSARITAAH